jgi:hypothetical protein
MKTFRKLVTSTCLAVLMLMTDLAPPLPWLPLDVQMTTTDAHAVLGRARRARRRGVAIGYAAGRQDAEDEQANESQSQQKSTTEQKQAAPEKAAPADPPRAVGALPTGSVVKSVPKGSTKKDVGGVEYEFDGTNYYRAAFQGSDLVYVTVKP